MKLSRLIIYFMVLAGIAAYIIFVEHGYKQDKKEQETQASKFIGEVKDKIVRIGLSGSQIGEIELTQSDSEWGIVKPIESRADEYAVNSVLKTLQEAAPEKTISEKDVKWSDYGFDQPTLTIRFTTEPGRNHTMVFGAQNPSKTSYYMRLDENPKLYLVADTLKNALEKNVFDLRDKAVFSIAPSEIDKVIIQKKGVSNEFLREGASQWRMTSPENFRVRNVVISTLLRKLSSLKALEIVDNAKDNLESYDLKDPSDSISVIGKDLKKTLFIGSEIKTQEESTLKKGIYVKADDSDAVFVIDDSTITDFDLADDNLRDKSIVGFNIPDIQSIEIQLLKQKWLFTKTSEKKWNLDEPEKISPIKDWNVTGILWKLRDLNYVSVISPVPSDLATLGLDEPQVTIKLNSQNQPDSRIIRIGWSESDKAGAQDQQEPNAKAANNNSNKATIDGVEIEIPTLINARVEPQDDPASVFKIDGSFVKNLIEDLQAIPKK